MSLLGQSRRFDRLPDTSDHHDNSASVEPSAHGARIPIHEALRKEGVNSCPKLAENQRIEIANFLVLFRAIIWSDSRCESIHPLSKTPIFGVAGMSLIS